MNWVHVRAEMRRRHRPHRGLQLLALVCAIAGLASGMAGCASTTLAHHADGRIEAHVALGPAFVRRRPGDALAIRQWSVGVNVGCGGLSIGFVRCERFIFDPRTCGVGLVEIDPKHPADMPAVARFADQVRAECAHAPPAMPEPPSDPTDHPIVTNPES